MRERDATRRYDEEEVTEKRRWTPAAGVPVTGLVLREGVRSHAVGRGLHHAEQEHVARLVRGALREAGVETTDETWTGSTDGVNGHGRLSAHTTF